MLCKSGTERQFLRNITLFLFCYEKSTHILHEQDNLSNSVSITTECLAAISALEAPQQCTFGNTFHLRFSLSCTFLSFDIYWNIKRCEITHPKMILLLLIYLLHWIPEEQLEEKMWRCQVIKAYCLLNCFSSLLQFENLVHKGGIKSNQSGFLKSTVLIIQIKLLEEQMRSDSNKCKGKRNKTCPDNVQKMRMSVFLKANETVISAVREVGHWPHKCLPCPTPRLSDGISCLESWEATHVIQVKFLYAPALCTKPIWSNLTHAINSNSPRNLSFIVL